MNAWLTLAVLVVVAVVVVVVVGAVDAAPSAAAGRRRPSQAGGRYQLDDVLRAKIDELEKLGVTPDDVMRYIWRMRQAEPGVVAAAPLSTWSQTSASSDQRFTSDRNLLVRHFVRNRTVSCNDGSPAGYQFLQYRY